MYSFRSKSMFLNETRAKFGVVVNDVQIAIVGDDFYVITPVVHLRVAYTLPVDGINWVYIEERCAKMFGISDRIRGAITNYFAVEDRDCEFIEGPSDVGPPPFCNTTIARMAPFKSKRTNIHQLVIKEEDPMYMKFEFDDDMALPGEIVEQEELAPPLLSVVDHGDNEFDTKFANYEFAQPKIDLVVEEKKRRNILEVTLAKYSNLEHINIKNLLFLRLKNYDYWLEKMINVFMIYSFNEFKSKLMLIRKRCPINYVELCHVYNTCYQTILPVAPLLPKLCEPQGLICDMKDAIRGKRDLIFDNQIKDYINSKVKSGSNYIPNEFTDLYDNLTADQINCNKVGMNIAQITTLMTSITTFIAAFMMSESKVRMCLAASFVSGLAYIWLSRKSQTNNIERSLQQLVKRVEGIKNFNYELSYEQKSKSPEPQPSTSGTQPQAESDSELHAALTPLSMLVAAVMCSTNDSAASNIPKIVQMGNKARAYSNINNLQSAIVGVIEGSMDIVWEVDTGLPKVYRGSSEDDIDVLTWYTDVEQVLTNNDNILDIVSDLSYATEISELETRGNILTAQFDPSNKVHSKYIMVIRQYLLRLKTLREAAVAAKISTTSRIEPTCLFLVGNAGTGKSAMVNYLSCDILSQVMTEQEYENLTEQNLIFTTNSNMEYFDGYTNQKVLLWEEYGMIDEGVADHAEREAVLFNQLVSCNNFLLPIATCELKNKVSFTSEFVICTSNMDKVPQRIADPSAIYRRRHFNITPRIKSEFVKHNNMLDSVKWLKHCKDNGLDSDKPDYATFEVCTHDRQVSTLTYDTLVQTIVTFHNAKKQLGSGGEKLSRVFKKFKRGVPQSLSTNVVTALKTKLLADAGKAMCKEHRIVVLECFSALTGNPWDADGTKAGIEALKNSDISKLQVYMQLMCLNVDRKELLAKPLKDLNTGEYAPQDVVCAIDHHFFVPTTCNTWQYRIYNAITSFSFKSLFMVIGSILALVAGVAALNYIWKNTPSISSLLPCGSKAVKSVTTAETADTTAGVVLKTQKIAKAESTNVNSLEAISKCNNNIALVTVYNCHKEMLGRTRAIFVARDLILVPRHLYELFTDTTIINININANIISVSKSNCTAYHIGDRYAYDDVTMLHIPDSFCAKNIIKHFATEASIAETHDFKCVLSVKSLSNNEIEHHSSHCYSLAKQMATSNSVASYVVKVPQGELVATVGWVHGADTKKGDCGSPLYNKQANEVIMGFHVASIDDTAFACIITRDWIEEVIANNKINVSTAQMETSVIRPKLLPKQVINLGKTSELVYTPRDNKIKHSLAAKYLPWEATVKPNHIDVFNGISPLKLALAKYSNCNVLVHPSDQDMLYRAFVDLKMTPSKFGEIRPLSFQECISGYKKLLGINMQSSMGYPYILNNITKKHVFEYDEFAQLYAVKEDSALDVELELEIAERNILAGDFTKYIWVDYLKAELLPIEKVDKGSARLFSSCGLIYLLLVRKYFGMFINYVHEDSLTLGCMIGIDAHSNDWGMLRIKLENYNSQVLAGDYSAFDRNIPPSFFSIFKRIVDHFYGGELPIRTALFNMMFHVPHQAANIRYIPRKCNPSGNPLTGELNSICNILMITYNLSLLTNKYPHWIMSNSYVCTYGDDNVIATTFDYNVDHFQQVFQSMGVKYTNVDKESNIALQSIDEIRFLSRKFVVRKGKTYAPLPLDTVKNIGIYTLHHPSALTILAQTLASAFIELLEFPIEEVDYVVKAYYIAFSSCKLQPSVLSPRVWQMIAEISDIDTSVQYSDVSETFISDCRKPVKDVYVGKVIDLCYSSVKFRCLLLNQHKILMFTEVRGLMEATLKQRFAYNVLVKNFVVQVSQVLDYHINLNNEYHVFVSTPGRKSRVNKISAIPEYAADGLDIVNTIIHKRNFIPQISTGKMMMQMERDVTTLDPNVVAVPKIATFEIANLGYSNDTRTIKDVSHTSEIVSNFTWRDTQLQGNELASINFPSAAKSVIQYECKLKFFTLIRADLEFELVHDATQFQLGSLIVVWYPQHDLGYNAGTNLHVFSMTAMHHVKIYTSSRTTLFTVPFVFHNPMFNWATWVNNNSWGTLKVAVFNPLTHISGSSSVDVIIKFNFSNIQLSGPTSQYQGLSTGVGTSTMYVPSLEAINSSQMAHYSDEAEIKSKDGIISGPLDMISNVASVLKGIPIIGSFMGTVSMVSGLVASAAKIIGLSKPSSIASTNPIIPRPFSSVCYKDGLDMSVKLGMDPKNSVTISPFLFGSKYDELALNYLIRTPTCIGTLKWEKKAVKGTPLLMIPITPQVSLQKEINSVNHIYPSMLAYVAMAYEFWRGDIQFQIEVVSTGFHTGSLVAYFIPYGRKEISVALPSLTQVSNVRFDLGKDTDGFDTNNFSFTVPYIASSAYKRIVSLEAITKYVNNVCTGVLVLDVMVPLNAPDQVANHVYVNIFVSAAENFELVRPKITLINKYNYVATPEVRFAVAQGGLQLTELARTGDDAPLFKNFQRTCRVDNFVMGETSSSVRDLLKIFTKRQTFNINSSGELRWVIYIPVHLFNYSTSSEDVKQFDTFYDHFMRVYRYSRGSMRHKWVFGGKMSKITAFVAEKPDKIDFNKFKPILGDVTFEGAPWAMCVTDLNPTLEYEVPFFFENYCVVHGKEPTDRCIGIEVEFLKTGRNKLRASLYEAIGDDFSAGYVYGPPALTIKSVHANFMSLLSIVYSISQPTILVDNNVHPAAAYIPKESVSPINDIKQTCVSYLLDDYTMERDSCREGIYFMEHPYTIAKYLPVLEIVEDAPTSRFYFNIITKGIILNNGGKLSKIWRTDEVGYNAYFMADHSNNKTSIYLCKVGRILQSDTCTYTSDGPYVLNFKRKFAEVQNHLVGGVTVDQRNPPGDDTFSDLSVI